MGITNSYTQHWFGPGGVYRRRRVGLGCGRVSAPGARAVSHWTRNRQARAAAASRRRRSRNLHLRLSDPSCAFGTVSGATREPKRRPQSTARAEGTMTEPIQPSTPGLPPPAPNAASADDATQPSFTPAWAPAPKFAPPASPAPMFAPPESAATPAAPATWATSTAPAPARSGRGVGPAMLLTAVLGAAVLSSGGTYVALTATGNHQQANPVGGRRPEPGPGHPRSPAPRRRPRPSPARPARRRRPPSPRRPPARARSSTSSSRSARPSSRSRPRASPRRIPRPARPARAPRSAPA